jgi:hypothetical protein
MFREAFGEIFACAPAYNLFFGSESARRGVFAGVEHEAALRVLHEIIQTRDLIEGLEELSRVDTSLPEEMLADSQSFFQEKRLGGGGGVNLAHVRILQVFDSTLQDAQMPESDHSGPWCAVSSV